MALADGERGQAGFCEVRVEAVDISGAKLGYDKRAKAGLDVCLDRRAVTHQRGHGPALALDVGEPPVEKLSDGMPTGLGLVPTPLDVGDQLRRRSLRGALASSNFTRNVARPTVFGVAADQHSHLPTIRASLPDAAVHGPNRTPFYGPNMDQLPF